MRVREPRREYGSQAQTICPLLEKGREVGIGNRPSRRVSSVDMMNKDDVERFWVRWEADAGIEWR